MKMRIECKAESWDPSFWIPETTAQDGEWIKIDADDPDKHDVRKVAKALKTSPQVVEAIATCLSDLRDAIEEDLRDLYEMIKAKQ